MRSLPTDNIIVPENRQRKEFKQEAIEELSHDFTKPHGFLQPIVLRDDEKTLVAGERRLRAFELHYKTFPEQHILHDNELIPLNHIPYVLVGDLSELELKECELAENLKRCDLTWQEEATAITDLHNFRVALDPNHTIKDTAREVFGTDKPSGTKQKEIQDAIDIAQYMDDPLVEAAPDIKVARKAIKEDLKNQERLDRLASLELSDSVHKLHHSSSFDIPESLHGTFDVILTDPPYGIDIHEKDTFDEDKHEYDDSDEAFQVILDRIPRLAFDLAKEQAHLYCFCDVRRFPELFVAFELGGWQVRRRPIIWDKGNTGSYGDIAHNFRACYDAILFANKGRKEVTAGYRDVININQQTTHDHPAGKPVELFSDLLKRSVLPGDRVADLFCGSGPIFPAADEHNCIAEGWEINEKYLAMAHARIEELK